MPLLFARLEARIALGKLTFFTITLALALASWAGLPQDVSASDSIFKYEGTQSDEESTDSPFDTAKLNLETFYNQKVLVFLSQNIHIITEGDIDKMVEDPWTLNVKTAQKISSLPPRLKFGLYRLFMQDLPFFAVMQRTPEAFGNNGTPPLTPDEIQMTQESSKKLIDNVLGTLGSHFTDDEMVDLAVFALSKSAFFPKTPEGWAKLKNAVVKGEIWIGLATVLALAASDNAALSTSMWLYSNPDGTFRLGWYGSFNDLGIKWHPRFSAGAKMRVDDFEFSLGGKYNVKASETSEVSAVEFNMREHLLDIFTRKFGWELSTALGARYSLVHNDPTKQGQGLVTGSLYTRRRLGASPLFFISNSSINTDFNKCIGSEFSAGIENEEYDLSILSYASLKSERDKKPDFKTGFFLGWGMSHKTEKKLLAKLEYTGAAVAEALEEYRSGERRLCQRSDELKLFGTGVHSIVEEQQITQKLEMDERAHEENIRRLRGRLIDYYKQRQDYMNFLKDRKKTPDTPNPGIYDTKILKDALKIMLEGGDPACELKQ
jgi:hypothetical protein